MAKHLQRELEKIRNNILRLGALVEDRVRSVIVSIQSRDVESADLIIKSDFEIDEMEVEIEEECLKVLALHQPVAVDLRFLVSVIKINNDLERIADETVNIAYRLKTIAKDNTSDFIFDYALMAEKARSMLKMSLDAFVQIDSDLAYKVCVLDSEVDVFVRQAYEQLNLSLHENSEHSGSYVNMFLMSRHIERIADHATNIAEETIYMVDGEIVRHNKFDKE